MCTTRGRASRSDRGNGPDEKTAWVSDACCACSSPRSAGCVATKVTTVALPHPHAHCERELLQDISLKQPGQLIPRMKTSSSGSITGYTHTAAITHTFGVCTNPTAFPWTRVATRGAVGPVVPFSILGREHFQQHWGNAAYSMGEPIWPSPRRPYSLRTLQFSNIRFHPVDWGELANRGWRGLPKGRKKPHRTLGGPWVKRGGSDLLAERQAVLFWR